MAWAGRPRVLGLERALAPGAVACLVFGAGACAGPPGPSLPSQQTGAGAGGSSFTPAFADGGHGNDQIFPIGPAGALPCTLQELNEPPVFAAQVLDDARTARREFFTWTTDEQVAELRRDQVLFSRSERPGMGRGYAFAFLQQLAQDTTSLERAQLASLLSGQLFEKARFAWPEPWPTRMGWPGEDYGGNLVRIVLKPEAWLVVMKGGNLSVRDQENLPVPLADALASPERLGAIFYEKDGTTGGPTCQGSFVSGADGYREYILGNLAMVEEWSLATPLIRDRLSANIEQLRTFFQRIRSCPVTQSAAQWNVSVVCGWQITGAVFGEPGEIDAYERSLAIPSDNYLAVPQRIAAMIDTLQGDLFEPDPLVVNSGRP